MNKRNVVMASCLLGLGASLGTWFLSSQGGGKNSTDQALLALIKNDESAFNDFIHGGGNVHALLPKIDGKTYTVAQGVAHFERTNFGKMLRDEKISYVTQDAQSYDVMTLAIARNNPDLLLQLDLEKPNYSLGYGKEGWTLLHIASALCSHRLTSLLHKKINWDLRAKDGLTPLTLAAESGCLPMLSYWKEHGANFRLKDGKGRSALSILGKKKDAALAAFARSFEERRPASSAPMGEPDFYKKRKIPKDQVVDHSALIEPEERPLEASETAEFSEFAD